VVEKMSGRQVPPQVAGAGSLVSQAAGIPVSAGGRFQCRFGEVCVQLISRWHQVLVSMGENQRQECRRSSQWCEAW